MSAYLERFGLAIKKRNAMLTPEQAEIVNKYLQTGDTEFHDCPWTGGIVSGGAAKSKALRAALVNDVRQRTSARRLPELPELDLVAFTRNKVEPMVIGLFPGSEREIVLQVLEKSVVFLTPDTYETVLTNVGYDSTAWNLANLYLLSAGAELFAETAERIVGLSSGATCYVSLDYFNQEDKFADFVVHEAAHIFHNNKRERFGLPFTRRREYLLEIDSLQRETFAYACEAYSRILELGRTRKERAALLAEMEEDDYAVGDDTVDKEKYKQALCTAVDARNGWKQILAICAPKPMPSMKEFIRQSVEEYMARRVSE